MENWVIKNKKADFNFIMQGCGVSEVLARCLVNKDLETPEAINTYLHPRLEDMYDPFLMKDMDKACKILSEKIEEGRKIRIIGDYDVDGVVSTYILYRTLTKLGANVDYEIPDRIKDGYGINIQMVATAHKEGVDTLLTCDNGIVAIEQVELAKSYGMTVIITDHHSLLELTDQTEITDRTDITDSVKIITQEKLTDQIGIYNEVAVSREADGGVKPDMLQNSICRVQLPNADAVINPKRPDCSYPYSGLCGAVITYKLSCALLTYYKVDQREEFEEELLSYAAIATVCDVMELTGENRIIVKHGLQLLRLSRNKGLLALMDVCSIEKEQLTAFHLGFVIGPCLNASGRLDTAKKGLNLLLAKSEEQAALLAREVRTLNDHRKEMTTQNVEKAIKLVEGSDLKYDKVLVVYLADCHESIAGIIAGRIRERFSRPTLVLTDAENCVKGSGRSIPQYNMIEELTKGRDIFIKVGGHPMAAGFSLVPENIELLRKFLNNHTSLTEEMLIPKVSIDIHLPFGYISETLVQELRQLEPFGKGNEKPLFAEKDLKIKSAFIIGKNASGVKLFVENKYGKEMEAIYFGDVTEFFTYIGNAYGSEEAEKLKTGRSINATLSITYFPKVNEYKGFKNMQLMIQNYR